MKAGFEYVCTFDNIKLFRKRKWRQAQIGPRGLVVGTHSFRKAYQSYKKGIE